MPRHRELVVYKPKIKKSTIKKTSKISKGNIFAKASKEQKFLGKTLPRLAWGAAKFAWKHPITTTVGYVLGEKLLKTRPGLKFPKHRQFDRRGRKIL